MALTLSLLEWAKIRKAGSVFPGASPMPTLSWLSDKPPLIKYNLSRMLQDICTEDYQAYIEDQNKVEKCGLHSEYFKNFEDDKLPILLCKIFANKFYGARIELYESIALTHTIAPDDRHILSSLFQEVAFIEVFDAFSQVLQFELKIINQANGSDTQENIFPQNLIEIVGDEHFVDYINFKYPLLIRRLDDRFHHVKEFISEFYDRLSSDLQYIICDLIGYADGTLSVQRVSCTDSDSHNGARRVLIIEFANGAKAIYKPRPVCGEAFLHNIISWANGHFKSLTLKGARVIRRENYGWCEFIEQISCNTEGECQDYYKNYGSLLGLMRLIGANDLHFENVVAHGIYPVIIDGETAVNNSEDTLIVHLASGLQIVDRGSDTIINTGLIDPIDHFDWELGSPLSRPVTRKTIWSDCRIGQSGDLEFVQEPVATSETHIPIYNNIDIRPMDYTSYIMDAFRKFNDESRNKKIESSRCINSMIHYDYAVRTIFRYTNIYDRMRLALYSPACLEDIEKCNRQLSDLYRICEDKPSYGDLVEFEWNAIWRGDIPHFKVHASSTEVWVDEDQKISGFLEHSPKDRLVRRIVSKTNKSYDEDEILLDYLLKSSSDRERTSSGSSGNVETTKVEDTPDSYLGELLDALDIRSGRVILPDTRLSNFLAIDYGIVNNSLYSGIAGILFACSYIDNLTYEQSTKLEALAECCLMDALQASDRNIGACEGIGGYIWLSSHLGKRLGKSEFLLIGEELVRAAGSVIYRDRMFDLYSGTSGLIMGATSLFSVLKTDAVADVLEQAGEHLRKHAIRSDKRIAFPSSISEGMPNSGYAHGAAGICHAFLRLQSALPNVDYSYDIDGLFGFLDSCFDPALYRWNEISAVGDVHCRDFWCHGLPGIAACYLAGYAAGVRPAVPKASLNDFLSKQGDTLLVENDSLCHGTLGNLDFLISDTELSAAFRELTDRIPPFKGRAHRTGNINSYKSHCLFQGHSGIAHQYKRMLSPGSVPSPLIFGHPQ